MLRDSNPDTNLGTCKQVSLHAPKQDEVSFETTPVKVASQGSALWYSKANVPLDTIEVLTHAPLVKGALVPDHWFVVCGRHWPLAESERWQLNGFLQRARK